MNFFLAPGILDEILVHAKACHPIEGCGLIAGRAGMGERFIPMENTLRSAIAFEMAPGQLAAAFRSLRESGEELAAIYHSHPSGPPTPSERDIARAYYPEVTHLIVSLERPENPVMRAFHITGGRAGGRVVEVDLHAIV